MKQLESKIVEETQPIEEEKSLDTGIEIVEIDLLDTEKQNPKKIAIKKILTEKKKKFILLPVYFAGLMIYLEFVFHLYHFGMFDVNLIPILLFSTATGIVLGGITMMFPQKIGKIVTIILTILISIIFIVQIIFYGVFQNYLSFVAMFQVAGQALDYVSTITKNIGENISAIVFLLVPSILIIPFIKKRIDFEKKKDTTKVTIFGCAVIVQLLVLLLLKITDKEIYSSYKVYQENTSIDMAIEKLGVWQATLLDIKEACGFGKEGELLFFDEVEKDDNHAQSENIEKDNSQSLNNEDREQPLETKTPVEVEVPKKIENVLNVDFDALISQTDDKELISLHEYFKQETPTKTNEYTGMFKGYNVIFVTAEGFSGYLLEEGSFPTLQKMATQGFVFENYYTPLFYGSTLGGEYGNLTGLTPANGQYLSMTETGERKNSMCFTLGRQLSDLNYKTIAYHNNTYTYYNRDISHPNLGYDWRAVGQGFKPDVTTKGNVYWPQSDKFMIDTTFSEYALEQPFHVYYLSVSGHVKYTFADNYISAKNKELFEDTSFSTTTQAYLASQYELEAAMTSLVEQLEKEGIADKTLIVLTTDHVPYDDLTILDELAGYELENTFEKYKNSLIIWSASMEQPIPVKKVCSSLDVLPTVSNLLGLPYDSRMLVGKDILSDSEGLVIFNSRSFITDQCMYDIKSKKVTPLTQEEVTEEYLDQIRKTVRNKLLIADKIIEYDYYSFVEDLRK